MHRVRSQARKAYEQMYQQATGQEPQRKSRKAGWSKPATEPRKKIDRNDGEVVSYVDINVTAQTVDEAAADSHTGQLSEQQVIDVEWEDIE